MMYIKENLLDLIGDTPMVYLRRFGKGLHATIAAKLEMFNPYSVKDRPALCMIEAAEREGKIDSGTTVIEATSGNTGLAVAFICAAKGYRCVISMSEDQSDERKRLLRALGAELVLTPAVEGSRGAKLKALDLWEQNPNSYYIDQHCNPNNPCAHRETTGMELWRDTDGKIDVFVAGLGTCGTIVGVSETLKERKASVKIVGVEPEAAPMLSAGKYQPHRQAGVSPGFIPEVFKEEFVDEIVTASEEASFETCRELARTEGIVAGISSGMTAYAARQLAKRPANSGKLIVCMLVDTGERYLSVRGLY
ncbi:cysteine synthase A [candidate division WOR-3 bacterium]|uniref:cysteine synthase n=1 Tax=candidate division WOR-3 bacterium TaxID=2052148 RepID=A0A9D5QD27_UNCW3|nr:cysteine synthase A [candidate division WOR-3 bacterium]MBD3365189.1 cysteine synthase A [candidate division WOR-3 bacterium]